MSTVPSVACPEQNSAVRHRPRRSSAFKCNLGGQIFFCSKRPPFHLWHGRRKIPQFRHCPRRSSAFKCNRGGRKNSYSKRSPFHLWHVRRRTPQLRYRSRPSSAFYATLGGRICSSCSKRPPFIIFGVVVAELCSFAAIHAVP